MLAGPVDVPQEIEAQVIGRAQEDEPALALVVEHGHGITGRARPAA